MIISRKSMRYISDIVKGLSADGLFLFEPSEQNERRNIMYTDIFDALRYTNFRFEEAKKKVEEYNFCQKYFGIRKVIFSCPATIVLWNDGTKTVVKSGDYDVFDPEKGLAMAIAKKALGNKGNYYNIFREWLPEEEKDEKPFYMIDEMAKSIKEKFGQLSLMKGDGYENEDK